MIVPGIQQWNKNVQVQANPGKRVRKLDASFATPIASGASSLITLYSPAGYISKILNMYLVYPAIAAATAGSKMINLGQGGFGQMDANSAYNAALIYDRYEWVNSTTKHPADIPSSVIALQNAFFDEANGMAFIFQNNTNQPDGGVMKNLILWLMDEKIS